MARHHAWLLLGVSVAMAACLVLADKDVNFAKGSTGDKVLEDGGKAIFTISENDCKTMFLDCKTLGDEIQAKPVCVGTAKVLADNKAYDSSKYTAEATSPVCNETWEKNFMTTLDILEPKKDLEEAVKSGLAVKKDGTYNLLVAKGACKGTAGEVPLKANVLVYCKGPAVPTPTPTSKPSSAVSRESIVVWVALVVMLLFHFGKFT